METYKKLLECDNYPPSIIVKKDRDWDILELEEDEYYNCYPKYYGSSEIGVCQGKKFLVHSKPKYPFLIQNRIQPKFEGNEEYVFILYLKKGNTIFAYYFPINIENKDDFLNCLCNVQEFIIPKFDNKNYSEIEYLLTRFDIVEDKNGKFWVKGINWDPQFGVELESNLNKMVEDIYQHINYSTFNYFAPLEKFVQTHVSNSSL